jgi:hypothetical protein
MPADHVHFNGSVNLTDAGSVMREIAWRVPSGLRRIPDGETGDRGNWIRFQLQRFLQMPWLVPAQPLNAADGEYEQLPQLRLADGAEPAEAAWRRPSRREGTGLRRDHRRPGAVHRPGACRDPCRAAPVLRGLRSPALHAGQSLALQVRVLNAVAAAAGRPVSFVSFTVPQYQRQDSYFAPLAGLTADPGTELNFALVPYHPAEQAPGTTGDQTRLIDAALAASPGGRRDRGICTECGMGRVSRDQVPTLLDLHRQVIAAG